MAQSGQIGKPLFNQVPYNYGVVNSIEGKFHLKLAGIGFVLTHDPFSGRHNYGRDQAPAFVSKMGSGDPTYRDSSFFPHWVQLNWRNGAKQDEWDDEGRFLASKNLDVTKETKLTLSKLLSSLSLVAGDVDVTCWAIDYSDSRKVFAGTSSGHVWRLNGASWSDMGDITAVDGGQAGRRVNCLIFSKIGGSGDRSSNAGQIYAGVGTPAGAGGTNVAEIYRYDGAWKSATRFYQYDALTAFEEFNGEMYCAVGGVAIVKKTNSKNFASVTRPGAPTAALVVTGSGNLTNGVYKYRVSFVTAAGETDLGTESNAVTVNSSNKQVTLSSIPTAPAAASVTARKIYRTKADGSSFFLLTTISDNTTATYTDNTADTSLGTEDFTNKDNTTAWATSKDIDYPGYIWDMTVYNQRLFVACGHPENTPTAYQLGTLWSFDGYLWAEIAPFMGTALRSLCVYDNLLFVGTYHGQLYVYNRANIDLLYEMPEGNVIYDMTVFDDKLYMAVSFRDSDTSENAVYIFDRAGTHKAHQDSNIKPLSLLVYGDDLIIGSKGGGVAYKVNKTTYSATGELQSSYFNAALPNIDKVWFDVSIEMDALPSGCKLEFYYKTDESDAAWIKVDETSDTGKKLAKFAFADATYSKRLSYKIVLTTSDNTKTPTIRKVIIRYIVQPDFKYLWRFKVACPDNLEWLDGSSPTAPLTANTSENTDSVEVGDSAGFPDPSGEKMYAVIENTLTGEKNEIYYTGKSGNTLIGCGSVSSHNIADGGWRVAIQGRHFHRKILELKQRKAIVEFVDIDSVVYKVLMHDYSEDGFVVNTAAGLENEVSISLLQA